MAGEVYKGLNVSLTADAAGFKKALNEARRETSAAQRDLRDLERTLRIDPGNTAALSKKMEDYRKSIESTEKELEQYRKLEEDYKNNPGEVDDKQWNQLQYDIARCEANLRKYKQALTEAIVQHDVAQSALGRFGGALEAAGERLAPVASGMQRAGGFLTRTVTPAIAAAGVASVKAAVDIDTSLTNVRKTVDGTEEQYQQLKDAAIEFSKTNAVSASQILDIQALGAQLGFSIDELQLFGEVVSGLDIATNMDAETAATNLAQFANITRMGHDEIENYASAIVGLGNSFATTEADVSNMAMRLAAAGTQVGMSQADILGLATALSSMGVEAEAGGTAVSTIMSEIDKAVATGSADLEVWAETAGMTADEFASAWGSDPVDALGAVLSGMEGATAEGGNMSVMLEDLGIDSLRQTDVMKRLAGNSELVAEAVKKANDEWNANTALDAEVENRNKSLAAQFEMLKNRVIAVATEVGEPLASALMDVIDSIEPLIEKVGDAAKEFADMDKEQQQAILKAVALAAALGPLLTMSGKLIGSVGSVGSAMKGLAGFLSKVGGAGKIAAAGIEGTGEATKALTAAQKATTVATGALRMGLVALAAVAAAVAIKVIMDAKRNMDNAKVATEGLRKATADSIGVVENAADGWDDYGADLGRTRVTIAQMNESQADLVRSMSEQNAETQNSVNRLEAAKRVIDEYMNQTGLTAQEQGRLKDAINLVNQECGTQYEVVDAANGKIADEEGAILDTTEAIDGYIQKKQEQIRLESMSGQLTALYEQQATNIAALATAEGDLRKAQEDLANGNYTDWDAAVAAVEMYEGNVTDAKNALEATNGSIDALEEGIGNLETSMEGGALTAGQLATTMSSVTATLSPDAVNLFADSLDELGFTTEQLQSLTDEELAKVLGTWDNTTAGLVEAIAAVRPDLLTEGQNDVLAWAEGLSSETQAAIDAATVHTANSVEVFRSKAAEYGIAGEESIRAFADAIAAGDTYDVAAQKALETQTGLESGDYGGAGSGASTGFNTGVSGVDTQSTGEKKAAETIRGWNSYDFKGSGSTAGGYVIGGYGSLDYYLAGQSSTQGIERGAMSVSLWDAGQRIGGSFLDSVKQKLGIASPSKEFAKIGRWSVEGLVGYVDTHADDLGDAGQRLADAYLEPVDAAARTAAERMAWSVSSVSRSVTQMNTAIANARQRDLTASLDSADIAGSVFDAVSSGNARVVSLLAQIAGKEFVVNMNGRDVSRVLTPYIEREMGSNRTLIEIGAKR